MPTGKTLPLNYYYGKTGITVKGTACAVLAVIPHHSPMMGNASHGPLWSTHKEMAWWPCWPCMPKKKHLPKYCFQWYNLPPSKQHFLLALELRC